MESRQKTKILYGVSMYDARESATACTCHCLLTTCMYARSFVPVRGSQQLCLSVTTAVFEKPQSVMACLIDRMTLFGVWDVLHRSAANDDSDSYR